MSSSTLRRLLSQQGEIKRIYLTPEDKTVTKNRERIHQKYFLDKKLQKRQKFKINKT